ncbi:zf-HC2 domain-containing protein [Maricaulis sp.]|uniref:anti-sigma factor family protein n=1 Tax=Maricaulis sp. TaxID=1486257 RepID=UPI00329A3C81
MTVEDETLMAYVDGELDAAENARVEAALRDDPALRRRAKTMQSLRGTLAGHFNPVLSEPVPDHLEALVRKASPDRAPAGTDGGPSWLARLLQGWHAPHTIAVASAVAAGILIGTQLTAPGSPGGPFAFENGRMTAGSRLASALDRPGAQNASSLAVQVSFRHQDGRYCRTFTASGTAGVACRTGGDWQIDLAAPAAGEAGTEVRTAGTALPLTVLDSVDTWMSGEALSAAEEETAAARGWQPE